MKTIYTDTHIVHQPEFELYDGVQVPYAETASRVDSILMELERRNMLNLIAPKHFPRRHIEAVHKLRYIEFLRNQSSKLAQGVTQSPSYFITDTYAPLTQGTYRASITAVDTALTGAQKLLDDEPVIYSLCRPPGHHAAHQSMGGYCYFNNAAIAANFLAVHGKVAVLDIDFHHGNGTQEAFYERKDVLYVSLHANPERNYPYIHGFLEESGKGQGLGFNINYPLASNTTNQTYMNTLRSAISDIRSFRADYLVVSAGFDTYILDPIGGFRLTRDVYKQCGAEISGLNLPTLIIQEGGYNVADLGYIVAEFLEGIQS